MFARILVPALLATALGFSGCRKAQVASYTVPKEKDAEMAPAVSSAAGSDSSASAPASATASSPAAPGTPSMATTGVPTATGSDLTWTAPADWQQKPASAMRKATYTIPAAGTSGTAELSITAFPNDVGGELANLNRWRSQVHLPPVGEAELASSVTRVEHNGLHFGVVDLVGQEAAPQHLLAAWVPYGGATWFFKLLGPDATVAKQKQAFTDFLNTIKPAATP
jgi:hypothetical protein